MRYFDVATYKQFSLQKMIKVNLFDTEHFFCDLYCLKIGQSQKPHTHQGADKIYYILKVREHSLLGMRRTSCSLDRSSWPNLELFMG